MSQRAVVVGAGVAGVAAALAARAAGYDTLVVSHGSGASALTSGALDWSLGGRPREQAAGASHQVAPELRGFWQSLGYDLAPRLLATGAGVLKAAAGSDRCLLDLGALAASSAIGVLQTNWLGDSGAALERALSSDPRAAGRTFVAVTGDSLFSQAERRLPLAALLDVFSPVTAERLVELAAAASRRGIAALLVGPYLGLDPAAHEMLGRAPIPIGETTSPPDGSAGRRLEGRLVALLARESIPTVDARVTALRASERTVEVTFAPASATNIGSERREVDLAILATGGLVGGGLVLGTGPAGVVGSPLLAPIADSGSLLGWDPAADGGSWLRPGLGPGAPAELGPVRSVGDVRRGALQTLLSASEDGLTLFRRPIPC
jgi:hypothetical protein